MVPAALLGLAPPPDESGEPATVSRTVSTVARAVSWTAPTVLLTAPPSKPLDLGAAGLAVSAVSPDALSEFVDDEEPEPLEEEADSLDGEAGPLAESLDDAELEPVEESPDRGSRPA